MIKWNGFAPVFVFACGGEFYRCGISPDVVPHQPDYDTAKNQGINRIRDLTASILNFKKDVKKNLKSRKSDCKLFYCGSI
jgi:hypothetical protein